LLILSVPPTTHAVMTPFFNPRASRTPSLAATAVEAPRSTSSVAATPNFNTPNLNVLPPPLI